MKRKLLNNNIPLYILYLCSLSNSSIAITTTDFKEALGIVSNPQIIQDETNKISYGFGYLNGKQITNNLYVNNINIGVDIDANTFIEGLKDSIYGTPKLTEEQIISSLNLMEKKLANKKILNLKKKNESNLKKSQDFLAANKNNKDIITLSNGLQYKIIKSGDPEAISPNINDKVIVNYRGTLLDGTEFDSSYDEKEPAVFNVKSLIKGWQSALLLMKPNDKWEVYIPPHLAYGSEGIESIIEANSLLIFEIELLEIKTSNPQEALAVKSPEKAQDQAAAQEPPLTEQLTDTNANTATESTEKEPIGASLVADTAEQLNDPLTQNSIETLKEYTTESLINNSETTIREQTIETLLTGNPTATETEQHATSLTASPHDQILAKEASKPSKTNSLNPKKKINKNTFNKKLKTNKNKLIMQPKKRQKKPSVPSKSKLNAITTTIVTDRKLVNLTKNKGKKLSVKKNK